MRNKAFREASAPKRVRRQLKLPRIHMMFRIGLPIVALIVGLLWWYTNTITASAYLDAEEVFVVTEETNSFLTWWALWGWVMALTMTLLALGIIALTLCDCVTYWDEVAPSFFATLALGAITTGLLIGLSNHYQNLHNPQQVAKSAGLEQQGISVSEEKNAESVILNIPLVKVQADKSSSVPSGLYKVEEEPYQGTYVFALTDEEKIKKELHKSISEFGQSTEDEDSEETEDE